MHKIHNSMSVISCIMSIDYERIIVYNKTIARGNTPSHSTLKSE